MAHYLDDFKSCGDFTQSQLSAKFHEILDKIIGRIKSHRGTRENLVHLLGCLVWDYQTADLEWLSKAKVFDLLFKGDGSINHAIHSPGFMSGKVYNITAELDNVSSELPIGHVIEVYRSQISSSILNTITTTEADFTAEKKAAAIELIKQICVTTFAELDRGLKNNRIVYQDSRDENFEVASVKSRFCEKESSERTGYVARI